MAEIRAGEGDQESAGSGYLVTPHLVLTAWHVVQGMTDIRVHLGVPAQGEAVDAHVVWHHQDLDVVLLRLDGGGRRNPPRLRWFRAHWVRWMPASFVTYAFPRFAPAGKFLSGRLGSNAGGGVHFAVRLVYVPHEQRDWSGASGANLFVWGRLVGVVSNRKAREPAFLYAAPFESLMAHRDFARLLHDDMPAARLRRLWTWLITGGVLVTAAVLLAALIRPPLLSECPPPVELVVSTSADQRPALDTAMAEYVDERAGEAGQCAPVRVSVGVAGGAQDVRALLARGWEGEGQELEGYRDLTMGPRPHVWLPDSSADLALLEHETEGSAPPEIVDHGSTRVTPLVVAYPRAVGGVDACAPIGADPAGVSDCLGALGEEGLLLARPSPRTSTSALIHTQAAYTALAPDGGEEETRRVEAAVTSAGLDAEGGLALLCALRRDGSDADRTAVLTTEQAVQTYNSGAALGPGCPAIGGPVDAPLFAAGLEGVADLDHPFVELDWGRDDGVRREVTELREWMFERARSGSEDVPDGFEGYRATDGEHLGDEPLLPAHEPPDRFDPGVWAERLQRALLRQQDVRGRIDVLIALDRSDSMRGPGSDGTRLETARARAHGLLDLLGPQDSVGLWAFPEPGTGTDVTGQEHLLPLQPRATADRIDQARSYVDGLTADYEATPLTDAVRDGAAEFETCLDRPSGPGACVVVVFTDGVALPGPREGAAPADVADVLDGLGEHVLVHVVSVGTEGCGGDGVLGRLADAGARCHPPSSAESDQLLYTIVAEARRVAE
ncbi:trypsin-like peptidase domain-containing protein [Nocardiopsis sp. Huas11]|uniref:trypsin-like peptidase domain-containing protein n=1 Tax=Nocardiopsis sp. Huas11 TaxID=2183912 RepID=UPI000EB4168C|nr:trypsin-like peptidase domain-containing protein [Nocardiopsis sp. Huas11]